MKNEEHELSKKKKKKNARKVLPRAKEIKNTTESKKVNGGEHPTYQWVKTYDAACLR